MITHVRCAVALVRCPTKLRPATALPPPPPLRESSMWPVMPTPLLPLLQLGLLLGGCRGGELAPPPPGSEQEIVEVDVAIRRLSVRPAGAAG